MKVMCDKCGVKEATKHYQYQYLCDSCYEDTVFPEYAEFKKTPFSSWMSFAYFVGCGYFCILSLFSGISSA